MTPKIIRSTEGKSLMGGRQTIKLGSEDTGCSLSVIFSVVPEGGGIPPHVHSLEDELFEIVEGELELTLDGAVSTLTKGDLVLLPRGIPHGFTAIRDTTIWVSLFPGGGEKMFVELAELPPGPPDRENIARICARYGVRFL